MSEEKAIRVIVFDGKQENWRSWKLKFLAKASSLGYRGVVEGNDTVPKESDVLDANDPAQKVLLTNRAGNMNAYSALALSCEGVAFGCIERAVTTDLPNGDAAAAWKNLCTKYEPKTQMSLVALKKEFAECKLESTKEDPDEWINSLEHMRLRVRGIDASKEIKDDDLMAHILANLPKAYSEFITMIENELEQTNTTLTMDALQSRLRNFYKRKFKVSGSESKEELALTAFKGHCRSCGAYGHKAATCKNKSNGNTPKENSKEGSVVTFKKKGHTEAKCWAKKKDEKKDEKKSETKEDGAEIALTTFDEMEVAFSAIVKDRNFFLCDSGATSHMTNSSEGLIDAKEVDKPVKFGNGETLKAVLTGKLKATMKDESGKEVDVVLSDVSYVPNLMCNLLSIGKLRKKGASITYDQEGAYMLVQNQKIPFKETGNDAVFGVNLNRTLEAAPALDVGKSIDISKAHALFGHAGEDAVRKTVGHLGLKVHGKLELCEACVVAKAKQKNVSKSTSSTTKYAGEKLYLDISSVNYTSTGGNKFMVMIVDDFSRMKWSMFLKHKSDLCEKILPFLKELVSSGKKIKKIRMDNAGENKVLAEEIKQIGIQVEFVAPNTPQQNGVVERAIATVVSRGRAMMAHAGFPMELKHKLWAECFNTSTKLSNVISQDEKEKKTAYELFYGDGKEPRWLRHMIPFGLIGYAANRVDIQSKLSDRASKVMFVGYADDHEGDCYRVYKFSTSKVVLSRDVRWSDKYYNHEEGADEDEVVVNEPVAIQQVVAIPPVQVVTPPVQAAIVPQAGRVLRSGRIIGTDLDRELFDAHGSREAGEIQRAMTESLEETNQPNVDALDNVDLALVSCVNSTLAEPSTFEAAMKHPNKSDWIEAIKTEYKNIKEKKVWKVIAKSKMKRGFSILGTKWIFKKKNDGRYRARLVVKGYTQVPGVDFTESHSPVANDVTVRIVLCIAIIMNWLGHMIDVETAFLYALLRETVYLSIPKGFNEFSGEQASENDVVELDKALYGLVQACRAWVYTLVAFMMSLGFKRSLADPCLLYRNDEAGYVLFLVYVDDCLVCGTMEAVRKCIDEVKNRFNIKDMGELTEFVGAKYKREADHIKINQVDLIDGFESAFDLSETKWSTPASPGQVLLKSTPDSIGLSLEQQSVYRSGVGKLLYLTKLSRPDLSCAVRELATFMDGANMEHWDALHRALEYTVATKEKELVLKPSAMYDGSIVGYSDSNYASNKDTRKSVSGFAIYFNGALVSWKSKAQQCVTLSSTEAEYVAMSLCVMEMEFVRQIVASVGFDVKLPMKLYVDNTGAMELAKNYSTTGRTKHIDVRFHYIREMIDQGLLEIAFVRTDENVADIFTKNLSMEKYDCHSDALGVEVQSGQGVKVGKEPALWTGGQTPKP